MIKIANVKAREIFDSRGNPTVEAEVMLTDGSVGVGAVPSGASIGSMEALELRDNDKKRFNGKGVLTAISNIDNIIAKEIIGIDSDNQKKLDNLLIELDGTKNKSNLGANAILAVSIANLHAAAQSANKMVCEYLNPNCKYMPIPLMNIINGGMHANNNLDIQEFMIMPVKADNFKEALRKGGEIIQVLKNILINKNYSTNVGDEGGFAPNLSTTEEAIELILGAVEKAGYRVGEDVVFALDSAASEFYKNNKYNLKGVNCELSSQELIEFYKNVSKKYPIFSIEDAMAENDENGWVELSKVLGKNNQLVGDDIFVTNLTLFQKYVKKKIANAILIKPNQIGTITETLEVINYAQKNNYNYILSHRSGETEDTTIAHLAVATGSKQIKTGSLCRTDRTAKYNELIRIEEKLGNNVYYPSIREIKNF